MLVTDYGVTGRRCRDASVTFASAAAGGDRSCATGVRQAQALRRRRILSSVQTSRLLNAYPGVGHATVGPGHRRKAADSTQKCREVHQPGADGGSANKRAPARFIRAKRPCIRAGVGSSRARCGHLPASIRCSHVDAQLNDAHLKRKLNPNRPTDASNLAVTT